MNQLINNFSFKIYETLFNEDDNLIFSPVCLATAMSLATVGARGESFKELQKALNLPNDIKTIGEEFQKIMRSLNSVEEITMVNKMFVHGKMKIKSSYKEIAKEQFQAEARNVDFEGNREQIVDEVNKSVSENTNQLITKVLDASDIDDLTRCLLFNAIHFKAAWKSQFKKYQTTEFDFHQANGKIVKLLAMTEHHRQSAFLPNCKELDAKVLKMLYLGDRLSFVIVLPNDKNDGYKKILKKYNSEVFCQILTNMPYNIIDLVKIPKFKIETSKSMIDNFKKLGVSNCFNWETSDFTGITEYEPLYISGICHKAVISVNEEGTEAAALTMARLRGGGGGRKDPIEMICDRPFHYFIYDEELNMILFAGFFAGHSL
ncbi:hypothetical protein SNEBB_007360, partial [Seison nebaliae]